ncbi:MAG: lipid-binding SYLF domain-containing protein [Terriglobia bacterium]
MLKRITPMIVLFALAAVGLLATTAAATSRREDVERIQRSAEVFHEIMATPDRAIPQELIGSAKCIAIIPGEKQLAFMVGGKYGKGLVTCRTAHGWSAPAFLAVSGGSYGFQIGGASTDIVMIFRNRSGLKNLLSDKFRIGAGATAAAGPVGRNVSADTDIKLKAEILTYARSRGVFAGVSLNGAVVQPDGSGNRAMYGAGVTSEQIVAGTVRTPSVAHALTAEISRYSGREAASLR